MCTRLLFDEFDVLLLTVNGKRPIVFKSIDWMEWWINRQCFCDKIEQVNVHKKLMNLKSVSKTHSKGVKFWILDGSCPDGVSFLVPGIHEFNSSTRLTDLITIRWKLLDIILSSILIFSLTILNYNAFLQLFAFLGITIFTKLNPMSIIISLLDSCYFYCPLYSATFSQIL